jgi:peptide/nickel transport system permease protein
MVTAAARRLAELFVTLLVTSFVIFSSLYVVPGSPIAYLARGRNTDAQVIAQIKSEYDLNQPFFPRYWHWLSSLLHGHLGRSLVSNETIWNVLSPRLGPTFILVAMAAIETIVVGLLMGVLAGLRGRSVDSVITALATVGVGIPTFVAAAGLISVFAVGLGWFPVFGPGTGFTGHLDHLFLPSVALAISSLAYMARLSRAAVRDERTREYVETSQARGLPASVTVRRHILRNATPSILTASGVTIVGLMASEVVVESAFGINGMGSLLVQSVGAKDFAVVQIIILIYVAVFVVVNTIADLVSMAVDPRLAKAGAAT